jgi:HSP20 family molecular chaperone IbpA
MRTVGSAHHLPPHAHVRHQNGEYLIELDVSDFTEAELAIELLGRTLIVRGDQLANETDDGRAFRLHEHLEESFRLPDDAGADQIRVFYTHGTLEIHAPRVRLEPRRLSIEKRSFAVNADAAAC